ncbi:MAG: PAS domain S-box protein [Desulfobacterales bacterium]|nr:PAS domain S-box protein [Desulfobacterales bacterium]
MKSDLILDHESLSDNMVLAVILIATLYWVLDSVLNLFFSNKFNLIAELFGPGLYDVYIRVIVLCLFIIFGSHSQSIINKLKLAKQKLDESEELWRSLVETAPDIITTVDREGTIRFINQSIGALSPAKTMGKCFYDFLPQQYHEIAMDSVESVFHTGETDSFEVRAGESHAPTWYTYRVGPLRISGKVVAATIITTNTTEFKQAEELMRYKELFDNVAEGVFICNRKGQLIESNDRVLESTGYSKPELLDLNITDLVDADQISFIEKIMQQVSTEKEARFEVNLKAKDDALIPNEINCRYVSYLGEFCFLCVARDITNTKMLHNQLIRSERLAATGQLAASIAHEINSPLQGITALLNVIRTKHKKDKKLLEKLDLVKSAFESIRDTVRNLIDLNRPGKEKKQPMDINQVIENTSTLVRSYLTKSRVKINLNLKAQKSRLTASPQQMGQVFMNLINNAVESITGAPEFQEKLKQTPTHSGEISIDTYNRTKEIVIKVKDTGLGFTKEDLEHIFDPFFTRKKTMGMGVGLSICHGIIEDHKGYIIAENDKSGGAVFTITLPLN